MNVINVDYDEVGKLGEWVKNNYDAVMRSQETPFTEACVCIKTIPMGTIDESAPELRGYIEGKFETTEYLDTSIDISIKQYDVPEHFSYCTRAFLVQFMGFNVLLLYDPQIKDWRYSKDVKNDSVIALYLKETDIKADAWNWAIEQHPRAALYVLKYILHHQQDLELLEEKTVNESAKNRRRQNARPSDVIRIDRTYRLKNINRGVRKKVKIECPVWGVRGHYRYYQSGKVIFIAEYKKGKKRFDNDPKGREYVIHPK